MAPTTGGGAVRKGRILISPPHGPGGRVRGGGRGAGRRRLSTSASQPYCLLDTTNYRKSVDQMLKLLAALGKEVDVVIR